MLFKCFCSLISCDFLIWYFKNFYSWVQWQRFHLLSGWANFQNTLSISRWDEHTFKTLFPFFVGMSKPSKPCFHLSSGWANFQNTAYISRKFHSSQSTFIDRYPSGTLTQFLPFLASLFMFLQNSFFPLKESASFTSFFLSVSPYTVHTIFLTSVPVFVYVSWWTIFYSTAETDKLFVFHLFLFKLCCSTIHFFYRQFC